MGQSFERRRIEWQALTTGELDDILAYLRSLSQTRYFVQSDFSQPPNFTFGDVGRFLPNVRDPGVHNLDFSLFKTFVPKEGVRIQFRAEAFNSTNSPVWGAPGTTVSNPSTFGIVTSASGNRTMQLALKLYL